MSATVPFYGRRVRIAALLVLIVFFSLLAWLVSAIHAAKWEILYEARREFAKMSDVTVLSETYSEDALSLDNLRYTLDVEGRGRMTMIITFPNGFSEEQQFWVQYPGCDSTIELHERVRYAIDHDAELRRDCS